MRTPAPDIKPGDQVLYGDRRVTTVKEAWRTGENVCLKLHGYIGYVVLDRHDDMEVLDTSRPSN